MCFDVVSLFHRLHRPYCLSCAYSDTWITKLSTWRLVLVLTPSTLLVTFIVAVFAAILIFYAPVHIGTSPKQYEVGRLPGPSLSVNTAHDLTFLF